MNSQQSTDRTYISPGSWFALTYPLGWCESEDAEDSFLFYNPDKWTGNFRISAYRGESSNSADECRKDELAHTRGAKLMQVGKWKCVYWAESFQENGSWYTTHFWITGQDVISVECSFTVIKGENITKSRGKRSYRYGYSKSMLSMKHTIGRYRPSRNN